MNTTPRRLIDKTHFSMAQQDVRYYLNGMLLETEGKSTFASTGMVCLRSTTPITLCRGEKGVLAAAKGVGRPVAGAELAKTPPPPGVVR